jgi:hypothetical protein
MQHLRQALDGGITGSDAARCEAAESFQPESTITITAITITMIMIIIDVDEHTISTPIINIVDIAPTMDSRPDQLSEYDGR